jgi:hypothetical protein
VKKIYASIASRCTFNAGICDVACQTYMITCSRHCQLLDGMKYAHFPQGASRSTYIHVEPVQDERNFKLKKQVVLTATLTGNNSLLKPFLTWNDSVRWAGNKNRVSTNCM